MSARAVFRLGLMALLLAIVGCLPGTRETQLEPGRVRAYFSPRGGAQEAIVAEIDRADKEILVQAYTFTNKAIIAALQRAAKAGVAVRLILDKSCVSDHDAGQAKAARSIGPTFIDAEHAIAHNKVMIIDGVRLITGSFNFTNAAEDKNAENLLILDSPELAAMYRDNWKAHQAHSEHYK
ncbi:MAG: phospholipase D family protein [Desulfovibrionaceae bacterium]|nr:phospholipase D family protein [Desulfovibrionaceae bacterium]MBF0513133.1 phospholipase D family protein [Desulfovibrionaceae bacterium]